MKLGPWQYCTYVLINLESKYLFSVISVAFSTLRKNPWGNKEAGQTQFIAIQKNRKFSM